MFIRKILISDLELCAKILEDSYSKEPYFEVFEEGNALKYIKEKFDSCSNDSFVICDGSVVCGFIFWKISCWANGSQAILEEVVIEPKHQGKGFGGELIKYSNRHLKSKKIRSIMLWALDDPKVIGFHEKNGYVKAKKHCVMFKNID